MPASVTHADSLSHLSGLSLNPSFVSSFTLKAALPRTDNPWMR